VTGDKWQEPLPQSQTWERPGIPGEPGQKSKLDLARRRTNADGMKWKATRLLPGFGQTVAWPKRR